MHRSAFIKALRADQPDIDTWLEGYRDNLTLEMMRVLQYTNAAIKAREFDRIRKIFMFINTAFATGNKQLRNSIVVSFLEHLDFGSPPNMRAESLLPTPLRTARNQVLKAIEGIQRRGHR